MSILAAGLALLAGAIFGLTVYSQSKGLEEVDGMSGAFISVLSMTVCMWILSPLFIEWHWWTSSAALIFMATGILFPAGGQSLSVLSIIRLGPALTSAFGGIAPLFAVVPAVLVLGESFGMQGAAGLGLIIAALFFSALGSKKLPRNWPLWALGLPLLASAARGLTQPFTKLGMLDVPSPFFATMVQASVSSLVLFLIIQTPPIVKRRRRGPKGRKWFILTGMANAAGILSLNGAIQLGDVTMVAPIASLVPLWALLFGVVLFRAEKLGFKHLVVAVLVVLGIILIVTR